MNFSAPFSTKQFLLRIWRLGAGKMAQYFRELVALPEDLVWTQQHMVAHNICYFSPKGILGLAFVNNVTFPRNTDDFF